MALRQCCDHERDTLLERFGCTVLTDRAVILRESPVAWEKTYHNKSPISLVANFCNTRHTCGVTCCNRLCKINSTGMGM